MWTNPLDDNSRWSTMSSRYEMPQIIVDEYRKMMREHFGDEVMDAMEAIIPPPYGTLGVTDQENR